MYLSFLLTAKVAHFRLSEKKKRDHIFITSFIFAIKLQNTDTPT